MPDNINTLTILGVKDFLGKALNKNLKLFDKLSSHSSEFDKKIKKSFGKLNLNLKATAGLATAAGGAIVAGVGAGLAVATKRQKEFNSQFLELQNLNLDKTNQEISGLRKNVLDTAFAIGKLPAETSKAFFDVQSGTGKFGDEVAQIVKEVGMFSTAMKVDFNTVLDGSIKGIKNYNLQTNELKGFLASMFKTVQTGIVTFEQLAKVQTDYAGAAKTIGQKTDSANKLFSVFTTKAKSAEEAATLTKSALSDLLKPATLKSFQKLGIKVFDKTTGKVKQLDKIVEELNTRFKGVRGNDRALNNLVNQFKGSEGLVALIGEVARNGDNMLETFRQFDQTEFSLEKALRNSRADLTTMTNIVKNKLDVVLTRIGFTVVPKIVEGLDYFDKEILPGIEQKMPQILAFFERFAGAVNKTVKDIAGFARGFNRLNNRLNEMRDRTSPAVKRRNKKQLEEFGFTRGFLKNIDRKFTSFLVKETPKYVKDIEKLGKVAALDNFIKNLRDFGAGDRKSGMALLATLESRREEARIEELQNRANQIGKKTIPTAPKKETTAQRFTGASATDTNLRRQIGNVVSGGRQQVRNVHVTIQKLNGIENLNTTNIQEGIDQVSDALQKELIRAIRDSEIAIAD